jgi:uncharacterized protein with beta-barrel porin domain
MPATHERSFELMKRHILLAVTALAAVAAVAAPSAFAEERKCKGALGAVTVDNLKVPKNATCTLNGTKVKGTIKVGRNATLIATNVRVVGNVQAEDHKRVVLNGTTTRVGGSVQLVQGGSALVSRTKVNGDVQFFENDGAIVVSNNRIGGNLQCKENDPDPTGGGNVVKGNAEDQCEGLEV